MKECFTRGYTPIVGDGIISIEPRGLEGVPVIYVLLVPKLFFLIELTNKSNGLETKKKNTNYSIVCITMYISV